MNREPVFVPPPRFWRAGAGSVDTSRIRHPSDLLARAEETKLRHPEGYRITLSEDRIRIEIGGRAAVRYAWRHLRQWQGDDPVHTPAGELADEPTFGRRGFMLDISRCKVPTRESLKDWLRLLEAFRFNELQLYTEHAFAYPHHQTVWRDASPMTPEDIRWLQTECRHHGIELVPNQNCFGHFEQWLRHPEYRRYAECPDGFVTPWGDRRKVGSTLKPDDDSFDLVRGLLDEILPLFDSNRVNIGCDETFELGQGATRERCRREGAGAVYADFVGRIMNHVRAEHGMRPEFWGDIALKDPEHLARLPRDAVALEWGYEANHPLTAECRVFARTGLKFVVCPGSSSWRSFAGRSDTMIENLRAAASAAYEWGADGMLLTDWGDCGHLQQEPVTFPALAWCGLLSWSGPLASEADARAWCDRDAFHGNSGDTARWLEAGRVSETTGVRPGNANLLFQWFLFPDHAAGREVSDVTLREVGERIDALPAPARHPEAWEQTLRNLRAALVLQLDFRRGADRGPRVLREAADAHAALWRARNREGGLAESLQRYTKTRDPRQEGYHES